MKKNNIISNKQSTSWEAGGRSVGQDMPRLLWKPKVHHNFHKTLPLDPNPSSDTTQQPMAISPKRSLPSMFPDENLYGALILPHACYMSYPSHPYLLINLKMLSEPYKLRNLLCNFLCSPVIHHYREANYNLTTSATQCKNK